MSLDLIATHSSPTITFLAARLVFFSTLFEAEVTKEAVEEMGLVDVFVKVRGMWKVRGRNECRALKDLLSSAQMRFCRVRCHKRKTLPWPSC